MVIPSQVSEQFSYLANRGALRLPSRISAAGHLADSRAMVIPSQVSEQFSYLANSGALRLPSRISAPGHPENFDGVLRRLSQIAVEPRPISSPTLYPEALLLESPARNLIPNLCWQSSQVESSVDPLQSFQQFPTPPFLFEKDENEYAWNFSQISSNTAPLESVRSLNNRTEACSEVAGIECSNPFAPALCSTYQNRGFLDFVSENNTSQLATASMHIMGGQRDRLRSLTENDKVKYYMTIDKYAWGRRGPSNQKTFNARKQYRRTSQTAASSFTPKKGIDQSIASFGEMSSVIVRVKTDDVKLNDGYKWYKYGEKKIGNDLFRRYYLRCNQHKHGCPAKKTIQRRTEDGDYVDFNYEGRHNHAELQ